MRLLLSTLVFLTAAAADDFTTTALPLLEKHCLECHGREDPKGGVELFQLASTDSAFRHHQLLERIAEAVKWGDMPPEDEVDEPPTETERASLLDQISQVRQKLESGDFPKSPGRPTIRRLNREEYSNTVRDLFGVEFSAGREFPADGAGGSGFDNTGDALFIPPVLMEKYLASSRKIVASLYQDPARRDAFIFTKPDGETTPETAARTVLSSFGSLAFRRRIDAAELERLVALFRQHLERGDSYEDALRSPIQALLLHPSFLFREEADLPDRDEWRISDFELATRLSYFLWSSMPDRELFRLADRNELSDPAVLRAQALRMLADPRSRHLARRFGGQWLGFDELREVANPDPVRFPGFTPSLRLAMFRESVDFLDHILRDNRSVLELLDADYTYLNAELARHYGIPGVEGNAMRIVKLSDRNRGGVIGQASILTATSNPLRTSPVKRGKWILDNLLGTPPPPPPQDAGVLPADDQSTAGLSFREQLETHRSKASCAGCHAKIDPLGFGLENFDAIGRWRETDINGRPVDSLATLPGDITFSTPAELKQLLVTDDSLFLRNLSARLLAYALGRPLEYYDQPVVASLVTSLRENQLSSHALIFAIIESHPFQNRSTRR